VSLHHGYLSVYVSEKSDVIVSSYSLHGRVLAEVRKNLDAGTHQIAVPYAQANVNFFRVKTQNSEIILKAFQLRGNRQKAANFNPVTSIQVKQASAASVFDDTLMVTKSGYITHSMHINKTEMSGIIIKLAAKGNSLNLPQEGNPGLDQFNLYKDFLNRADNILSYQLNCGGWPKGVSFNEKGKGGDGPGTFDNGATTLEITVMAATYNSTKDNKYLESARKGIDYILKAQYSCGGWPQFYPLKGGYANHVTYNDDGMSRVLFLLQYALEKKAPFDTDVVTESQFSKLKPAIDKGIEYTLKAQIIQNGKKTAWCAQHGKDDYKPKRARAYEHPSISGSESINIIGFLMTQPQTPEIKEAVMAAINWFNSPDTYLADYTYDKSKEGSNPFIKKPGSKVWFRFYDIKTNKPIFSNYDGKIYIGLENQGKKKGGYRWGGDWGYRIINYAKKVGYLE
jgi:PelA/Pel-15E family pectate lyase